MPAPLLSSALPSALVRQKPHARRITIALVCSALLHAALSVAASRLLALAPAQSSPLPAQVTVLQAVLQAPPLNVPPMEVTPTPEPEPEPVVVPAADPPAAAPPPRPATTPSVAQPAPPADPSGSVTLGVLTAQNAGDMLRTGDRYPAHVDREPRLLGGVLATYPAEARRVRAGGRVAVVLDLDERGQVTNVELARDDPLFSQAVTEALQHARFAPAEVATHPVPYWIALEFVFSIDAADPATRAAGAFSTTAGGTTAAAPAVK